MDSNRKRNTAGIFLLLAGLALFTYGGRRLEPDVVLMKAITICMECIGIG
ncbi:CD1871A family CXXC motif-containing protein [Otoolea muris]|nr:CD1871A family CXXC motif-containing protein [Otoolea muris]